MPHLQDNMSLVRVEADKRRSVLVAARCRTYVTTAIAHPTPSGSIESSIICLCCGVRSFNPNDIENKYCGYCHQYHEDNVNTQGI